MKPTDHPISLRITRGYCPICHTIGTLVLQEASFKEPLTCNAGHSLVVGVPGGDVFPHVGDEVEGYGHGV